MLKDYVKKDLSPLEEQLGREEEQKRAFLEEAGIEDWSAQKLRDSMLSSEEVIIAKREQLDDIRIRKSRKPDWDEFIDAKRRMGRVLHHSEIISKLKTVIPDLYVDDGLVRNTISLYKWNRYKKFGDKTGGTEYLGWMQYGDSPEYEIDLTNEVGIAVRQKRGWRTVLMNLICRREEGSFLPCSVITEQQVYDLFGSPTNGETASKFRERLWKFRNTSPEQAKLEHELMEAARKYRYC